MEYTVPYDDELELPLRWRRAHNELSPPSSPAVDFAHPAARAPARIIPKHQHAHQHPVRHAPTTVPKPVQARATKELTPPISTQTARTTAVSAAFESTSTSSVAAVAPVRDDGVRDDDRSSSSSPIPPSSPTPACPPSSDLLNSRAVTPPPSRRYQLGKRPVAVFAPPIRDTPNNPFIEGGPADLGFRGPFGADARTVAASRAADRVQKGRTTYVFRGQRITYEDPEYNSGDSDSDNLFGPNGLQPRLLFPPRDDPAPVASSSASTSSSSAASRLRPSSSSARLAASLAAHERHLATGSSSRAWEDDPFGGDVARDEKGIDIDTFFGPSAPISRPSSQSHQQTSRTHVHADAGHLLQHCDDWSSDTSDEESDEDEEDEEDEEGDDGEGEDDGHDHTHIHASFEGLEQVRMDMDHLVPPPSTDHAPPPFTSSSTAMTRDDSSHSHSSTSSSSMAFSTSGIRSERLVQGGGNKRKWGPGVDRYLDVGPEAEADGFGSGPGSKRARLAGPSYRALGGSGAVQGGGGVGLGLSHLDEPRSECEDGFEAR
ncbi:unnamed protein product [Tilletia controversa]|uniref:Uncharacterized protein n=2 Tax=Tilletia TaxID=13289 RepID=A0A177VGM4_9BASI|nr:hypothetical protein CF336_g88 [Tilletia laevis]KAE8263568.1 hypothetical protein A4X03_0g1577 [Tilletia caries]CAD6899485.1 unnamed protein product [Tilletia controversa]KAE8208713.1 hypothetical protein CF335_g216 [Tilletia laevis]CAD6885802.1 unnamed protein product [Tilletia caries]